MSLEETPAKLPETLASLGFAAHITETYVTASLRKCEPVHNSELLASLL